MTRQHLVFLPNLGVWALAGGVFVTDVTNASRTGLMDLQSLSWHAPTLRYFDIPIRALAEIRSNAEVYGRIASGPLAGVLIAGPPHYLHGPTELVISPQRPCACFGIQLSSSPCPKEFKVWVWGVLLGKCQLAAWSLTLC